MVERPTSSGIGIVSGIMALAIGAGALWLGIVAVRLWRQGDWGLAAGATVGTVVVAGVTGVILLVGGLSASERARAAELKARRAAAPEQPWRWRPEWVEGRIEHEVPWAGAALLWGFAAVWNTAIVSTGAALHLDRGLRAEPGPAVVLVVFLIAGLFLASLAVRATAHRLKYGRSVLELQSVPGVLGGELRVVLHPPRALPPDAGLATSLECVRRVQRVDHADFVNLEWRIERHTTGGGGAAVPVTFEIPFDCPETTPDGNPERVRLEWTVKASAAVPGIDYAAGFEVPVFRTPESDPARLRGTVDADAPPLREPPATRIRIESTTDGFAVLYPSPGWLPGWLVASAAAPAVAGAISWWSRQHGPDLLTTLATGFGIGALLLAITVLGLVMNIARVEMRPDAFRIIRGIGRLGWSTTVPRDEVHGVRFEVSRSGSRPVYSVELETSRGRGRTAALSLRSEDEARWLTAELQQHLGKG